MLTQLLQALFNHISPRPDHIAPKQQHPSNGCPNGCTMPEAPIEPAGDQPQVTPPC